MDPEVAAAFGALMGGHAKPEPAPIGEVNSRRALFEGILSITIGSMPAAEGVTHTDFSTPAPDGHSILLRWHHKKDTPLSDSPAVLYLHGGGMFAGSINLYDRIIAHYVSLTSVPFLAVEYRLAPEHPYPTPIEDCYAGLRYLHSNAASLGVDTTRIAVMGDSAGGGLAAALTHVVREKNGPPLAKQILVYPMLDDRNTVPDPHIVPFATWDYLDNATGWQALLGDKCGTEGVAVTAAPARMTDATGLPELYLDVGELDIFRDEDVEYVRKCGLAGVSAELHLHPGVPHAWEGIAPKAGSAVRAMQDRVRAIMSIKSVGRKVGV